MFLKDLNHAERCAFMELAYHVAAADGDVAGVEADMLACFRIEMALDEAAYPIQGTSIADAAAAFASDKARRAALMELMMVVMADGVAHPGENDFLVEVAQAFGLDDDTHQRQFAWVQRMMALVASGARLVELGDPYAVA